MFHKSCLLTITLSTKQDKHHKHVKKYMNDSNQQQSQGLQIKRSLSLNYESISDYQTIFFDNHYIIDSKSSKNKRITKNNFYNLKEIKYSDAICEMCVICHDKFNKNENLVMLDCTHKFHKNCIKKWLCKYNNKCPLCNLLIQNN
tara:strand:- start:2973 stop:3407 length:435 start_codon:yes stop_codon:yes gene_type:complete